MICQPHHIAKGRTTSPWMLGDCNSNGWTLLQGRCRDICMRLLGPCYALPVCQEGWSKDQKIVYNVSTLVAKLCETEERWMYTFLYSLYIHVVLQESQRNRHHCADLWKHWTSQVYARSFGCIDLIFWLSLLQCWPGPLRYNTFPLSKRADIFWKALTWRQGRWSSLQCEQAWFDFSVFSAQLGMCVSCQVASLGSSPTGFFVRFSIYYCGWSKGYRGWALCLHASRQSHSVQFPNPRASGVPWACEVMSPFRSCLGHGNAWNWTYSKGHDVSCWFLDFYCLFDCFPHLFGFFQNCCRIVLQTLGAEIARS